MKRHVRAAGLIASLGAAALVQAQTPAQPAAQLPTFKAEVEYVDVDVIVTDEQGRFVRDLGPQDFQVFEDGRRQAITNFTLVDIPVERADRPLFAQAPIEPDVESNERPFDGRIYVLGGRPSSQEAPSAAVYIYTPAANSWTSAAAMPIPKVQFGAVKASDGNIYVGDFGDRRIQVFSADGDYLTEWGDLYHPMDIWEDAAGRIYAASNDCAFRRLVVTPLAWGKKVSVNITMSIIAEPFDANQGVIPPRFRWRK